MWLRAVGKPVASLAEYSRRVGPTKASVVTGRGKVSGEVHSENLGHGDDLLIVAPSDKMTAARNKNLDTSLEFVAMGCDRHIITACNLLPTGAGEGA